MHLIMNGTDYGTVLPSSSCAGDNICFTGEGLTGISEITNPVSICDDFGRVLDVYDPAAYNRQEIIDGEWKLYNVFEEKPVEYDLLTSTANMTRMLMKGTKPTTADEVITCSAIYDEWKPGNHAAGEIFSVDGDPWECFQNYDNSVYPDIKPGNASWYTFNRPFHGTSRETAREFVHPTGAHDIYKKGEWAVQGGKFTECLLDTAYSLEEYPAAWRVEE